MDKESYYGRKWNFTMDVVFYRLDRTVKEGKLYLNPKANLSALADMAGTNRTYASKAVCARYRNFKDYINTLRIENLLQDIHDDKCGWLDLYDEDDFANRYGFSNRRSMDRILVRETGCTYNRILKRRRKKAGSRPSE